MCSLLTLVFFITSAIALAVQKDEPQAHHERHQTSLCGSQQYSLDEYTCYGDLLCPIEHGFPLLACGEHCYDPLQYSCSAEDTLVEASEQPAYTGIVTLFAASASDIDWLPHDSSVAAYAGRLIIGGASSSHCPTYIDPDACFLVSNITETWLSSATLATVVADQHLYIQSDGTVAFSRPGDADRSDQLYDGLGSIYLSDDDFFGRVIAPSGLSWQACSPDDEDLDYLELRASTPDLLDAISAGEIDCDYVTLEAEDRTTSGPPFSAWEYN